ncbi:MAG: HesA/MoeB/ThiF family protein [Limnochordia bacterium]|nr:HesA/MoeB/ThiF family protein [Bacillota bacterium]
MALTDGELKRYNRQLILREVGREGQERLRRARVLVVGAGGLGSPAAYYLAAAGVGTLGIVDSDRVDLSNLQRQILHRTEDLGRPKVESAARALRALNPLIEVKTYPVKLTPANAMETIGGYDVVIDAVDNFPARFLLNDACVLSGTPLVEAGVLRWEGMIMTVLPGRGPCYRCLFPEPPPPGGVPGAGEVGVMGAIPGVLGVLQALEAIKLIVNVGEGLAGRLLLFDGLTTSFREVAIERDPACPVCGSSPRITSLGPDYPWEGRD